MAISVNRDVSPEKRLLLCCARTQLSSELIDEIRELAALPLDWDPLLAAAAQNSLTPLLARHLSSCARDAAPVEQLKRLTNSVRANTARCLILTAELVRVMDHLRNAGITAVPYKGPVTAVQSYGDITLREFEDLDMVLRQQDMPQANEVMVSLGYSSKFPPAFSPCAGSTLIPGEYHYRDGTRRIAVELHTERTLRHFPFPPDLHALVQRLVTVSLSGHELQTFAPADALVMLCVHGTKDFWERISWIADVAGLIQTRPEIDWDAAFACADSCGARRMVHLGLALAAGMLGAPLPDEVGARVRRDPAATALTSELMNRLLRDDQSAPGAAARFSFRRRVVDGALAGWRYSIRLTLAPAEEDWEMMSLPAPLAPLYVFLRPLRLLRKYSGNSDGTRETM